MIVRYILIFILGTLCSFSIFGQQDPQFSQNMFNKLANNPGYAGSMGLVETSVLHRSQWIGFGDNGGSAISTQNFSINAELPFLYGGVGLNIVKDKIAEFSNLGLQASYAYRTQLGLGQIGMGMSFGIIQSGVDGGDFRASDSNDPSIPTGMVSGSKIDFGAGIYYNTRDVYLGFSSSHLAEPVVEWSDGQKLPLTRHYFLIAGYTYDLNQSLLLHPSIYLKSDAVSSQLDINTSVIYNNKMWGGVSYRLDDGLVMMSGLNINEALKFGLAYDIVFSKVGNNSIEFLLAYNFNLKLNKTISKYKSPRFL